MPETAGASGSTSGAFTVTVQVDSNPPSSVFAVITATPSAMPTTKPSVTVATLSSLLLQSTVLLPAFSGRTVAVSIAAAVAPLLQSAASGSSVNSV